MRWADDAADQLQPKESFVYMRHMAGAIFLMTATLSAAEAPNHILFAIRSHTTEDVIGTVVWVHEDCPFEQATATKIADGVFIRSRVKNESGKGALFLKVSIFCVQSGTMYVYDLQVRMDLWGITNPWMLDVDWGSFGIGREEDIKTALKNGIEKALTDFIRAHM